MELNTIAQYGTKKKMSEMTGAEVSQDYFEIASIGEGTGYLQNEEVAIRIRADFKDEAIIIPKTFQGLTVGMVKTEAGIPSNLRRIFFEKDNTIRVIGNNYMSAHNILEYCDIPVLTKLELIGNDAFANCSKLVLNSLPNTITKIDNRAFYNCQLITINKLPNNLEEMGTQTFAGCVGIKELELNNTQLLLLPDYAFSGCTNLKIKNETIDCLIEEVGSYTFENCSSLVLNFDDIDSANRLKKVGYYGFGGTPALNLRNLPSSIAEIGGQGFSSVNGAGGLLTCNIIPKTVTKLGSAAFMFRKLADENMGILIIENPNIQIDELALWYLSGVTEIWVPKTVDLNSAPWNSETCFGCTTSSPGVVIKHNPT